MKQFDTTGYNLSSYGKSLGRKCHEYEIHEMNSLGLVPLLTYHQYVFGFNDLNVCAINLTTGEEIQLFHVEGYVEGLRILELEFMDSLSGTKVWVVGIQAEYDWGNQLYYFK